MIASSMGKLMLIAALVACGRSGEEKHTRLIVEVDRTTIHVDGPVDMQQIIRRIEAAGNSQWFHLLWPLVKARKLDDDHLAVDVYSTKAATVDHIVRLIESLTTLEFRILANIHDHAELIEKARQSDSRELRDADGKLLAWWVPVSKGRETEFTRYADIACRKHTDPRTGKEVTEVLVVKDPFDVTGAHLVKARCGYDANGTPCIFLTFNQEGGRLFGQLTSKNLPEENQQHFSRRLGMIFDGYLFSAPLVKSKITTAAQIVGRFTRAEVEEIADLLNAGALPARLRVVERAIVEDQPQ